MRLARAFTVVTILLAASASAVAQEASREALIADAERARDAGDHDRALELALAAAAIRRTASLELFVAQQRALTGRRDEALASASECVRMAEADGALRNREIILQTCRDLVDELAEGLALVTVRVPSPRSDLRVSVNGQALPASDWGRPHAVPPGTVRVEATAPGASMRQSVIVGAGEHSTVEIRFDAEPTTAAPSAGISPVWLALPLSVMAAFGVGAIVTGALVLDRGGTYASLYDRCVAGDGNACAGAVGVRAEASDLQAATNVSWVAAAVGAVAAIVTLFVVDLRGEGSPPRGEAWGIVRF